MNYENYDPSFPDQPVVDLYLPIWANLPAFKSKPAFIWADDDPTKKGSTSTHLTYSQLNQSVQTISSQLLLSLQKGDTVIILSSPGLEFVEIIFACQRAGLLSVPIFPPDPFGFSSRNNYNHLARVLLQTKPKAAIAHPDYITAVHQYTSSSFNNKMSHLLNKLQWISTTDVKEISNKFTTTTPTSYNGCKAGDVYLVQYTSGATGIPKPVLVTAGSAAHNVRVARKAYDLHPNSMIVSWLPQYHDCGLMFLLLTVVSGATSVLTSPLAFVKRPRLWLDLISEFKATCTPVPSFALPLVVKRGGNFDKLNLWSMKNLIIINEPIYRASVEEFVDVFKPFGLSPYCISPSYGLAENCTFVSTAWRRDFEEIPIYKKLLPSARLGNSDQDDDVDMNIVVVNEETNEEVEDGTEGEIWVSSPSNCSGYLHHPSLTREVFQARLRNRVSHCFVRSGDCGVVVGAERFLFVTGRCSDVIKLNRQNGVEVHPHYIERAAYDNCPEFLRGGCVAAFKVSESVVVVAEMQRSEKDGELLKRIFERIREGVVREEGVEVGVVALVKCLSIPKTTSGKIMRWAAKQRLLDGKMSVLMEMKFGNVDNSGFSWPFAIRGGENKDKGGSREGEEERETSMSSYGTRPSSLLSLM